MDSLLQDWAKLGVMFCVAPAAQTPDLERLLLDTARHGSADSRLFNMAAAWLSRYRNWVDSQSLAFLISSELAVEHRPTLGLLLDLGAAGTADLHEAIRECVVPTEPAPLFDVFRQNSALAAVAASEATAISRRWGRWTSETRLRTDALRPYEWIAAENPKLVERQMTARSC